jgi:phosphoribosylanthranilate isomerase
MIRPHSRLRWSGSRAVRVEAKICGLTRPDDAAFAAEHGAWRLGVVFAGGPRMVDTARARQIVAAASGAPVLGVFGPSPVRSMLEVIEGAGLAGAQLHGDHAIGVGAELRGHGYEVWRVVAIDDATDLATVLAVAAADADAVLLEAKTPGGSGGRGIAIQLELARKARAALPDHRVVLAGGMRADNVTEAIRVVGPDAVDVSSGIESLPGLKDRTLVARFLENVIAARATG